MDKRRLQALAILFIAFGCWSVGYAVQTFITIPNYGNVKTAGIEAYADSACTIPLTSIQWGYVDPGGNYNFTFYLKNTGNSPVTLNMTIVNWTPVEAATYLSVTWDAEANIVQPAANQSVLVSLSVSPAVTGIAAFQYDSIFYGVT